MDLKFPYGQQFFNTQISIAPICIFLHQSGDDLGILKPIILCFFLEKPIWGISARDKDNFAFLEYKGVPEMTQKVFEGDIMFSILIGRS